jgi:hypothetical protein
MNHWVVALIWTLTCSLGFVVWHLYHELKRYE